MDTSETYTKMCEKAEEIQSLMPKISGSPYDYEPKEGELGSFYLMNKDIEIIHHDNDTGMMMIGGYGEEEDDRVWLPRQDQLQEMVGIKDVRELLLPFHRFTHPADGMHIRQDDFEDVKAKTKYRSLFTSMEQLWLAFVMKEKYNKVWNGSEWISKE